MADPDSFSVLYPAYIRGVAYLQMHEGRLAAAEFEKLLANRGLVGTSVTGALSHVQLARAQRLMGEEAAARKSYEDSSLCGRTRTPIFRSTSKPKPRTSPWAGRGEEHPASAD